MSEEQYIKDVLVQIQAIDPEAFDRFASEHSLCFQKGNGKGSIRNLFQSPFFIGALIFD